MAYWNGKLKYQQRPGEIITLGSGENTFPPPFDIKKSEASYSRNTSSRNYPALSVKPGRVGAFIDITTPNALGQRANTYPHVVDGTVWKRWDGAAWQNVQTGLTNTTAKLVEFNTEATRYTLMFNGTEKYAWDGAASAAIADAPATKLVTVDDYRVYALLGTNLKCSALGDHTDWTTADDADTIALTSARGTGTALTSYKDAVIAWTEHSMHVLYGNDPYDFYLNDPMEDGCISDRSVVEHRGILYFLDFGAFKKYTGGRPVEISQKVKTYIDGINLTYKTLCVAGKHGRYVYLSIPYGAATTCDTILEYDTELDTWYVRDEGYVDFVNIGEFLYGVQPTGELYKINSGTDNDGTAISWSHITGVWNQGTISQKKVISDYWAVVDLPVASTLTVSYSTTVDADDFVLLYTFTGAAAEQNTRIQVPTTALQNIDWHRLKFAGTGPCTIHGLEEILRVKAR